MRFQTSINAAQNFNVIRGLSNKTLRRALSARARAFDTLLQGVALNVQIRRCAWRTNLLRRRKSSLHGRQARRRGLEGWCHAVIRLVVQPALVAGVYHCCVAKLEIAIG